MGFLDRLARNRGQLAEEIGKGRYQQFSAVSASRFRQTRRCIRQFAEGRVLDVGCGHMPFRRDVLESADSYEGFDVERRVPGVEHVGDVQDMEDIPSAVYDTVLCLEVLEHVPRPGQALREIARVLKPGGKVILSVPHLSRLHEEPHDYYRYTKYGLRYMLSRAGLETVSIEPREGLLSFLAHQVSTVVLGLVWSVPGLRQAVYAMNWIALVRVPLWLDRHLVPMSLFPSAYMAVGRKQASPAG